MPQRLKGSKQLKGILFKVLIFVTLRAFAPPN